MALHLLGGHVGGRPHRQLRTGHPRGVEQPGDAEVDELGTAAFRAQDVRRGDVAVDDTFRVDVVERLGDLRADVGDPLGSDRSPVHRGAQRRSVDQLQHEEGIVADRPRVEDLHEPGMGQAGEQADLRVEPGAIGRLPGPEQLHGHRPLEDVVGRLVDVAHPAAGDVAGELVAIGEVRADGRAGRTWVGGHSACCYPPGRTGNPGRGGLPPPSTGRTAPWAERGGPGYVRAMGAGRALGWATARANRAALVGLAVLVAVGLGVSVTAFAIAARTDRAFDRYVDRAEVGDLVVNPSLSTVRAEEIITGAEGVTSAVSGELLNATFDDGAPRPQIEVDNTFVHAHVSRDGRYVQQDRPVVREGRMLRPGREEVVINRTAADELGVGVGDRLPVAFWVPSYNTPGLGPGPDDMVTPVGRVEVTVVGIVVFADEVLTDQLYPIGGCSWTTSWPNRSPATSVTSRRWATRSSHWPASCRRTARCPTATSRSGWTAGPRAPSRWRRRSRPGSKRRTSGCRRSPGRTTSAIS